MSSNSVWRNGRFTGK